MLETATTGSVKTMAEEPVKKDWVTLMVNSISGLLNNYPQATAGEKVTACETVAGQIREALKETKPKEVETSEPTNTETGEPADTGGEEHDGSVGSVEKGDGPAGGAEEAKADDNGSDKAPADKPDKPGP